MRKNTKLIIWIIVASFGIWGVGSAVFTGLSGSNTAGIVYGKKIPNQEFNRQVKMIQLFEGSSSEDKDPEIVEQKALEQIALAMKARKEGIKVTDEEVREEIIEKMSGPQAYDDRLYQQWVRNVFRESPRAFEEKIRDLLSIEKLLNRVRTDAFISDEDLKKKYFSTNPDATDEDFEQVKDGYRSAMTELANINKIEEYIDQIVTEAEIRNLLKEERDAEETFTLKTPAPGPAPIKTPVPLPEKKN